MPEKYDPNIHHRCSIRLTGHDYSQDGLYFVTICTQNRMYMFGDIVNDEMRLNNAGFMIKTWWEKVSSKFPSVQTDGCLAIPSHFHGIINIVEAAPYDRPIPDKANNALAQHHNKSGQPHRVAPTLGGIVNWFKTMTTNHYIRGVKQSGWPPFDGKLWQRNYYEHIIRNEGELYHLYRYIAENPSNWRTDKENPNATL